MSGIPETSFQSTTASESTLVAHTCRLCWTGRRKDAILFIRVDTYSRWIEVYVTMKMTSEVTIDKLREAFAASGIPHTLVSDNRPCFMTEQFAKFLNINGVRHIRSAPYDTGTNR